MNYYSKFFKKKIKYQLGLLNEMGEGKNFQNLNIIAS